jgi:hypothetical protein
MRRAGYDVLNEVSCRMPLSQELFKTVLAAFSAEFPRLTQVPFWGPQSMFDAQPAAAGH